MTHVQQQQILVIDTGGFINGDEEIFQRASIGISSSDSSLTIYTVPQVFQEVRDPRAREQLNKIQSVIQVKEPDKRALKAVIEFAKKTGDFPHLSRVDIQILALTLELELARNGTKFIKEPICKLLNTFVEQKDITQPVTFLAKESVDKIEVNADSSVEKQEELESVQRHLEELTVSTPEPKQLAKEWDTWINNDNIEQALAASKKRIYVKSDVENIRVGCMTNDFSMQNLLLQMGLELLASDGRRIKRLKSFVLRCQSCFHITKQVERLFCPHCGNYTLSRTACRTDKEGNLLVFPPKHPKKPNLRGTKYPLPKPQSGRNAHNLILCEDQYIEQQQKKRNSQKKKSTRNVLDPSTDYNANAFFHKEEPLVVAYGKGNPNQVRKKPSRK
eukprot:jgi/Galph1/5791/GphlegSOOS_G4433.1